MLSRRDVTRGALTAGLFASPLAGAVRFGYGKASAFTIARDGRVLASVFVDAQELPGVRRAANDLAADIGRVIRQPATVVSDAAGLSRHTIIVGSLGNSAVIDGLVRSGRLKVDRIRGKWEAYLIQTLRNPLPGVEEALVIVGSDKRGAIYGVYDLSGAIGVSPWYWWADVPVPSRKDVSVAYGDYVQGSPAVKYRGIFLNDEAPCLSGWTTEKFGGMNRQFYTRLFELMLRLRANYLWPAMWNNAFAVDDPANAVLADEYGIVMGTSHHEPMMRAHKEWTDNHQQYGNGEWNYATNREAIRRFFKEGMERNGRKEAIVTVGMRGDGDTALESTGSMASDVKLLEGIIADQRRIISEAVGKPASEVPQVWVLFTEVYKYYDAGLQIPDDVTLMFTDDNVGNLRRLPTPAERTRSGGSGIYFHMDMHGGPFSYQWINSNPLPKIWEQMNLANRYGANQIWIANVGDLKPLELPVEFFIAMAWNPAAVSKDLIAGWTLEWAKRQFGADHAAEIALLASRYAKYNAWRKPEQLSPATYSLENYREAGRVCAAWARLEQRAEMVNAALSPEQRDAFYQLVLYPVKACANLTQMYVAAARNARFAQQARLSTRDEAAEVRRRFLEDRALRNRYNHVMTGGKWNHMMDQTHIGYFQWYPPEADIMPALADLDLSGLDGFGVSVDGSPNGWPGYYLSPTLPTLDSLTGRPTYFEVYPRSAAPVAVKVVADRDWVIVREAAAFSASPRDRRYWVDVDWSRAPVGRAEARITVEGAGEGRGGDKITIKLIALRATAGQERAARGAFGGLTGAFAIPADGFQRNIPANGVRWEPIPDYGRVETAMSIFPVDSSSFPDPSAAPRLEYAVFLPEAGTYQVDLVTGPTLETIPGRRLAVAVGLDDQPPTTKAVFGTEEGRRQDFLGSAHPTSTANNARTMRFSVTTDHPGRHVLTISMVDPTLVLQSLIVSRDDLRPSFFGPPCDGNQ
ncbi:glycosyl hydrolase 115 family protein [Sphingomonas phyllosphaerae]|uniref:glycosyl hydrolase 115 family protein n=1 Tax=Sphingomonas phyllosphaerae TaxID=257003 RepID=UPI0004108BA3|nr:glycosyl hydrolase 115 family protein [Sphingomonas phyllosphaerae]